MQKIKAAGCERASHSTYDFMLSSEMPSSQDVPWTSGSGFGDGYTCHVKITGSTTIMEDLSEYAELDHY